MEDKQELLPIKRYDKFMIGPYSFVCLGWRNGRILALRDRLYEHSLSMEVVLSPGFRMIKKVKHENT